VRKLEQNFFDAELPDIFGYYALQIGRAGGSVLTASRIQQQWILDLEGPANLVSECDQLPFTDNQFDVIALPHTLETEALPHEVLREAWRVLRPEGHLLMSGFNPYSFFGLKRYLSRDAHPPWQHEFISLARAKDWLTLLGFDLAAVRLTCYALPFGRARTLARLARLERAGELYWPFLGSVYAIRAVKRVAGVRLLKPAWARSQRRAAAAAAPTRGTTKSPS
jgi:Methylase involved in ubiquinone/menaquinone biosynthesis